MTASLDTAGSTKTDDATSSASVDSARNTSQAAAGKAGSMNSPSAPSAKPDGEEPSMALEPDLPLDGRDALGEAMIRDLPQSPELSEPASQPDPSNQAK